MKMKKMKKEENENIKATALKNYKKNVGVFYCSTCATEGAAGQPAATMRELRKMGYDFELVSEGIWCKSMKCKCCGIPRSHYKLLSVEPTAPIKERCPMTDSDRNRCVKVIGRKDAFTDATIQGKFEVDHKEPFTRLEQDINIKSLTDEELKEHFQILTPSHNKLKDKRCQQCKKYNKRPPFFGIKYWYAGNENYEGTCVGCGWYDGVAWRNHLNKKNENIDKLIQAYKDYINVLTEAYDEVFHIATIHGYCCSKESIEKGEMMRSAIRELELEVSSDSESEKK